MLNNAWAALPILRHILLNLQAKPFLVRARVICLHDGQFDSRRPFLKYTSNVFLQGSRLHWGVIPHDAALGKQLRWLIETRLLVEDDSKDASKDLFCE